ncbi:MAG: hypothetical protein M1813_004446 [Trichoglossum hirsutum]|nr:MAG: hypothetical protein M1813_004446 [Trichoglossum hirsutum]
MVACVEPLIKGGAKLDHRNRLGLTSLSEAAMRNNLEIGSLLLNSNANMHIADERGETPLFHAISCGNHDFVELLLQKGDGCTNVTIHGATVLHYTAEYGDARMASILASARLRGIDREATDANGRTAMEVLKHRLVVEEEFEESFERLLDSVQGLHSTDSEVYFDVSEW